MGKGFGTYLRQLKQDLEHSHKIDQQLPSPNVESVDEIIAYSLKEPELFSYRFIENSKILVIEDPRSLNSLTESFRQFPADLVTQIWMKQETWGACYDILSSLRASGHLSVTLTFILDPINDPMSWPTLQNAYPRRINPRPRTRSNSNTSIIFLRHSDAESQQQDVISLTNSSLSGFSWCVCSEEKSDETRSLTSEASWEILHDEEEDDDENEEKFHTDFEQADAVMETQLPLPIVSPKSYREALLAEPPDLRVPTSKKESSTYFCQLTRIFPKNLNLGSSKEKNVDEEDDFIDDPYVDYVLDSRMRVHNLKVFREKKKKFLNCYDRKHAR